MEKKTVTAKLCIEKRNKLLEKVMVQNVPFNYNVNIYDKLLILILSSSHPTALHRSYIPKQNTTQNPLHQVKEIL